MQPSDLTAIRRRMGLTQDGLAKLMNVDVRTIRRWESGERSIPGPAVALLELLKLLTEKGVKLD